MQQSLSLLLFVVLFQSVHAIRWSQFFRRRKMGQAVRVMKYDREANERNAISVLEFLDRSLKWHRLDDGVMGGQSETNHMANESGALEFKGTINTNGGGFCSIRAPFDGFPKGATGLRINYSGDGKTYKLTLSSGKPSTFGPSRSNPSWQADLVTRRGEKQAITIPFSTLLPSWGGGPLSQPSLEEQKAAKLDVSSIHELGFMLSLKLSDGSPNPEETFGQGICCMAECSGLPNKMAKTY